MKELLSFDLDGLDSLANIQRTGIKAYATNSGLTGGMMNVVWLYLGDDSVLSVHSKMNDLAGWEEVGTLVFRSVRRDEKIAEPIDVPDSWRTIASVNALVIDEPEFAAESGLLITNLIGEELIVVCGADICAVQICSPFYTGDFVPEYDLDRYCRRALA